MSEQKFFLIETLGDANDDDWCFIENFVQGLNQQSGRIHRGEPMTPIYPADAKIFLKGDETGLKLGSFVGNSRSMMLVSGPFRRVIEDLCVGVPIEYLPVSIHDHRKRPFATDYHIVNPLGTFDCLDEKKTDIEWDDDEPGTVIDVDDLVLDRAKMKNAPELFRVHLDPTSYVVGRKLARAIYDADFTNVMWTQLPFND